MFIQLVIINLFILSIYSANIDNKCNTLYLGSLDKIMIKTQSYRTKVVLDNLYKKRSKQSGMMFSQVKNCYNNVLVKNKKEKSNTKSK
jgi:hypothetical protein